MNRIRNQKGFTLIEALVAIVIFTIGIIALYTMQSTSVRGNANAIALTRAANSAADQVEKLIGIPWELDKTVPDELLDKQASGSAFGSSGLDEASDATADGFIGCDMSQCYEHDDPLLPAVGDRLYTVYWNVADDVLPSLPDPMVKEIRVIVVYRSFGQQKQVVMNYYKQQQI